MWGQVQFGKIFTHNKYYESLIVRATLHDCLFILSMTKLEFVFKYLSAILFVFIGKIINCTELMK